MNLLAIFTAAEHLHHHVQALHTAIQTVLPQIEDILRTPAAPCTRQAAAQARLAQLLAPTRQFLLALDELHRGLAGQPLLPPDHQTPPPPAPGIDFKRLGKLTEPMVPEKVIEVFAPLRGERGHVHLRLEALRPPEGGGYEVVVYRKETLSFPASSQKGSPPRDAHVWSGYDTISSSYPTVDLALQQVLGFLQMRCD